MILKTNKNNSNNLTKTKINKSYLFRMKFLHQDKTTNLANNQ
jgi:hypothetical protein